MQCANCKSKLPATANFCPQCGTAVPGGANIDVEQNIGIVKGEVVGTILAEETPSNRLQSTTNQKVDKVDPGGTVVGTVLGEQAQVGGQRHYGDIIQGSKISTGNITNSTGVGIGPSVEVNVTQGASAEEIGKAFAVLLKVMETMPEGPGKTIAQTAVQGLQAEAQKGEQAEEGNVQQWLSFLAQTAPDIWEVAIDTFFNPVKGLSTVFKKIAERARQENQK